MTNLTLYLIAILICIFIFLTVIYKNYNEPYKEFDDNNKPEFVVNYENIDFNNEPNYKYENITQYNFDRLFAKVEKINKNKVTLKTKSNYNFFTQSTTDDKLRSNLDIITKYVLLILNEDGYYEFTKTNFGDVEMWVDKKGNEEIKYELFLWDKRNYFQIKLWVDILKIIEGEAEKYGIKNSPYIFPDFNIGWPFKDQIIPLPTDTVTPGNFDTSLDSISPNNPSKIKYLYLNQIEIQNSTLIVDYHKNKYPFNKLKVDENGFSGINDLSLEYAVMKNKGPSTPYLEKGRKYNEWPTLDSELKWMGQYPSKAPPIFYWDNEGIYSDKKPVGVNSKPEIKFTDMSPTNSKELCDVYEEGTRWSSQKEELQPFFWVSNYQLPKCGENEWLFSNLVGNSNAVGGPFFGGGKR
jgi:hypothetical protein